MERTARRYHRIGKRYGIVLFIGSILIVVILLAYVLLARPAPETNTWTTVIVSGDPVIVWSVDRETHEQRILTIPEHALISGLLGYGAYTIDAMVTLGAIDPRDRLIFPESVGEAVGLPISSFVVLARAGGTTTERIAELFQLPTVIQILRGGQTSNLDIASLVFFWRALGDVGSIRTKTIDLSGALVTEPLPDGTKRERLDEDKADEIIGNAYELPVIRKEGLRVGVLNTTKTQFLGNRAGRSLGHLGVFVTFVGNDETQRESCEVHGLKAALASRTAELIRRMYGCNLVERTIDRVDVLVYMGRQFARRFEPRLNR